MKIFPNTEIKYISMDTKNLVHKDKILPVNTDYIFLFDIDDTLYKLPSEMEREEMEKWKFAYDHYKTDSSVPFTSLFDKAASYEEAFKIHFDKNPLEVEKIKGFMDYSKYITKDKDLASFLEDFPFRVWCFTNGMKCRAEVILKCLGLCNSIEGVICMEDGHPSYSFMGKPQANAYKFVEELLNIKDKSKVYFFDDRIDNIEMGVEMGWNSVLITKGDDLLKILKKILIELSK